MLSLLTNALMISNSHTKSRNDMMLPSRKKDDKAFYIIFHKFLNRNMIGLAVYSENRASIYFHFYISFPYLSKN